MNKTLAMLFCSLTLVTWITWDHANAWAQKAQNVIKKLPENSSITLTGNVTEIRDIQEEFDVNYGSGTITIQTDEIYSDLIDDSAADHLNKGERVTVSGYLDDSLLNGKELDAHTIIREDGRVLYSTAQTPTWATAYYTPEENRFTFAGRVKTVNIAEDEFTVDYGAGTMQVDTTGLVNNPLDADAANPVVIGDYVVATGWIDQGVFEKREVRATDVLQLEYL